MQLDVVNAQNEKVGSLDLRDEVFGGRVKLDLVWEAVVHQNASERRGTHATKTRAQVGEARNPLWRKGGTVFGPHPRDYGYALPRKVVRGGLRHALIQKVRDGAIIVVDRLEVAERRTKLAAELLTRLGAVPGKVKTLLVDVRPGEQFALAVRNLAGVRLVSAREVTARDVMDTARVVVTRAALERLQDTLGPRRA